MRGFLFYRQYTPDAYRVRDALNVCFWPIIDLGLSVLATDV
jgi:hypothetical protein